MTRLLVGADRYCQSMNWQTLSLFKLCCIAFGVVLGVLLPPKQQKPVFLIAFSLFLLSYIPLMSGFYKSFQEIDEEMYL